LLEVAVVLVPILIASVRARPELSGGSILTWAFVAGFGTFAVALAVFYVRMERLSRS
jgi:hypothetical protein